MTAVVLGANALVPLDGFQGKSLPSSSSLSLSSCSSLSTPSPSSSTPSSCATSSTSSSTCLSSISSSSLLSSSYTKKPPPLKSSVIATLPDRRVIKEEGDAHQQHTQIQQTLLQKQNEHEQEEEGEGDAHQQSKQPTIRTSTTTWANRQRAVAQAQAKSEYKRVMSPPHSKRDNNRHKHTASHNNINNNSNDNQVTEHHNVNNNNNIVSNNNNNINNNNNNINNNNINNNSNSNNSNNSRYQMNSKDNGEWSDYSVEGDREKYYCRYCDTTWPLNYFRNRQQFGAHCSNCSRKRRPRDEPNVDPPRQRRRHKRPRKTVSSPYEDGTFSGNTSFDDEDELLHSSSPSSQPHQKSEQPSPTEYDYSSLLSSSFEKGLMDRLLNVVENKLVEVNELEMIRKELQIMKSELLQREDRRQSRLGEVKNMIVSGVSELRMKMTEELLHKEDECKRELEEMRNNMMVDFVLKERVVKSMLSTTPDGALNDRVIQQQLQEMRNSFERKLEEMKTKMGSEVNGMEQLVAAGIMKCEATIQDLLSELSAELNYQLEEVRIRFLTLERVIKEDPRNIHRDADDDYPCAM